MKKTIIITGAGGALGKACVARFSREDYDIIGTLSPGKNAPDTGKNVRYANVDLANERSVNDWIKNITEAPTGIDAVVLAAGGFAPGSLASTDAQLFRGMMSLNFETAFYTAKAVFEQMKKAKKAGRIIFISSATALHPEKGNAAVAYTLSKNILCAFAQMLNDAGKQTGIKAIIVAPATIDTPANREAMPDADTSAWITTEGLADLIAFAASDTGAALNNLVLEA